MPATLSKTAVRNDEIRARLPFAVMTDRVVITRGIQALGRDVVFEAIAAVKNFDTFTPDNDPHLEHDFGAFTLSTWDKCFWKIDDYQGQEGIRCLLTVLSAEEY